MSELDELYQEIILDHNRRPRNFGHLEHPTHSAEGYNPLCGDQVTVQLHVKDGCVNEIAFQGEGCAISKASASLMTIKLKGKPIADAEEILAKVYKALTSSVELEGELAGLGDVAVLQGVRHFPARVKCATLAWHTCEEAFSHEIPPAASSGAAD